MTVVPSPPSEAVCGRIPLRDMRSEVVAYALVDSDLVGRLSQHRWSRHASGGVVRTVHVDGKQRTIPLSHDVLGARIKGLRVRHRNGDPLDNRRSNLAVSEAWLGRQLRDDPALARNDGRAAQMERIDDAISKWTLEKNQQQVLDEMEKAEVPAGRIYSVADIAADPHYAARGMIEKIVASDGEPLKVPGIVPKLSATPGAIRSQAPKLGEHTDEVLREIGFSQDEIAGLKKKGIA